jgi:hypothetical protein
MAVAAGVAAGFISGLFISAGIPNTYYSLGYI